MRKNVWTTRILMLTLAGACGVACTKKGDGAGKRQFRPGFAQSGTIFDNGPKNQAPTDPPNYHPNSPDPTKPTDPVMNADAVAILAKCFGIDAAEVVPIVGWTDATKSVDGANKLCTYLDKAQATKGILATAAPADIDAQ